MVQRWHNYETGHIISAKFLNTCQELLSDFYNDLNFTSTNNIISIYGTASEPAQISIDGRFRTVPTTISASVVGAVGTYSIYALTSDYVSDFSLSIATTTPSAARIERVGDLYLSAPSTIDNIWNVRREINADKLYGSDVSDTPAADSIPLSSSNSSLDPDWFTDINVGRVPIGGIRKQYVPSGVSITVPTGWVILSGQTLTPAEHAFVGVASITLPDMRGKISIGANNDYARGFVTQPNGSTFSTNYVGQDGIAGTNQTKNLSHTHTASSHTHVEQHAHLFPHRHNGAYHYHTHAPFQFHAKSTGAAVLHEVTDPDNEHRSWATTVSDSTISVATTSVTTSSAKGSVASAAISMSGITQQLGVAYLMRVF